MQTLLQETLELINIAQSDEDNREKALHTAKLNLIQLVELEKREMEDRDKWADEMSRKDEENEFCACGNHKLFELDVCSECL